MKVYDERVCLCALNKVLGYVPGLGRALMDQLGSAEAVFEAPRKELCMLLRGQEALADEISPALLEWADGEIRKVGAAAGRFIACTEEDYPSLLAQCPDHPLGLYFKSSSTPTEVFGFRRAVAIVGTRDLSPYGREWCVRLVQALARARIQPLVVSGLAYGADAAAHRTALEEGLPTVGVMATGVDEIYPWRNQPLGEQMLRSPGSALVTDYPTGTSPVGLNFVRRNRIIAGLAEATLVIESKTKGGSLITAKYANDYDRDVYALPGRVDDVRSQGCNSLIRMRMADIITEPEDLVERLGLGAAPGKAEDFGARLDRRYGSESLAAKIGRLVHSQRGVSCEELARLTGAPFPRVLETVALMETDNILTTDLLQRCYLSKTTYR